MNNSYLHRARKAKNDEFYTRYADIELELQHYNLKGKSVYSPCDDYRFSQFTKFFTENFDRLGITRYCCTNYNIGDGSYRYEYDGRNTFIFEMNGDGDFHSDECCSIRDEYDIVITNPPFSLCGDFFPWVANKEFLILGNTNVMTLKDVFPLVKSGNMWAGCTHYNEGMYFTLPDGCSDFSDIDEDGNKVGRVASSCWWTNMENEKNYNSLILNKKYNSIDFPIYDDYDAIEVSCVADIPLDYNGLMGVPITFMKYYNPSQFEIVGMGSFSVNGKKTYKRILIRRKTQVIDHQSNFIYRAIEKGGCLTSPFNARPITKNAKTLRKAIALHPPYNFRFARLDHQLGLSTYPHTHLQLA